MKKNTFSKMFEISEQQTNDVLGAYPEKVHVSAFPERRYLKTTRNLTIFSIISLSVTILFASILYMLIPNIKTEVKLITKDRQMTGLKFIEPYEVRENPISLYLEKLVNDYVIMRHEVKSDVDNLINLWVDENSKLNLLTSPLILKDILDEERVTKQKVISSGFTRKVNILWTKPMSVSSVSGIFVVRFETLDFYYGKPEKDIKTWEVFVRINRQSPIKKVEPSENEKDYKKYVLMLTHNPLNVKVTNYVISYVGSRPVGSKPR
ncbi:MAG: hypothetical protein BWY78_00964 [Alphaproteobacteria bacterium ADurb.Bin438]|nr:MAG: hypothetical protein BWY78_00964 [Alphaproteobacteria bacterium ADurb.Bin438]